MKILFSYSSDVGWGNVSRRVHEGNAIDFELFGRVTPRPV